MAKQNAKRVAKRANRPNPREDRNYAREDRNFPRPRLVTDEYQPTPKSVLKKKIEIIPRNLAQERYIDLLCDERNDIVFGIGPAGTGKTHLATIYALRELMAGNIKKIIITRPLVGSGAGIGYLPGGIIEKLAPWCRPVLDTLKEFISVAQLERMMEDEIIEMVPFSMVRGMTAKDAIVIVDESQNATPEELKMMMTRIGDATRMFITGDLRQSDLRGENGLTYTLNRLMGGFATNRIAFTTFEKMDVVRHPVIDDVLRLFGE